MRVLIMGGTSGIGLATAELLTGDGADVTVTGRDPMKLERARGRLAGAEQLDGTDRAAVSAFLERFGSFEHLMLAFSPGSVGMGPVKETRFDDFEAAALKKDQVDMAQVPPRYRSPYFLHIWANGYESNYYSYTWGEILDDDAFEWFTENGGLTRANGQRFRDLMLGPGYIADPMSQYRNFRGRDPSVKALERQRGLD